MKKASDEKEMTPLRIAIAHDYLTQRGGAERVVLALHAIFPEAQIHTLLYDAESTFPQFKQAKIVTSPINGIRALRKNHRAAMPLLPFASRRMKIDADIVIASSSGWAHAFPTSGTKVVYCHNPARWLYQRDEYLGKAWWKSLVGVGLAMATPGLKFWDKRAAHSAEKYLANSSIVQQRIKDRYGFDAPVVFPPHLVDRGEVAPPEADLVQFVGGGEYFLVVSRLLPYKNVDAVIRAFNESCRKLVVVGDGPMKDSLIALAGESVRVVSNVSDANLGWLFENCTALVAVSREDLGLTPLEASAWGKPTLALRAGGYLDTIREGLNGTFVDSTEPSNLNAGIDQIIEQNWDSVAIELHSQEFSLPSFKKNLLEEIRLNVEMEDL